MKKQKLLKQKKPVCTCNYDELKKVMGSEKGITHYKWCPMRKEFDKIFKSDKIKE